MSWNNLQFIAEFCNYQASWSDAVNVLCLVTEKIYGTAKRNIYAMFLELFL